MATFDDIVRGPWPMGLGEAETLWEFLDFYRATLANKCVGLTSEQLKTAPIPSSTLTLLGLVRHLVEVERWWIDVIFFGDADVSVFPTNSDDRDGDFNDLDSVPPEEVISTCVEHWQHWRSRVLGHGLDEQSVATSGRFHDDGTAQHFTLRFIAVHLVEEYARHCGHADLLREALDGSAGH